ncbi:MAG: DNA internalization-related competence protein ComEC/Rec2 [Deltaproteobacteria bacterium]|nr:DNA internalization-related competence protein ComEC/Rec2 [Deltaproteobacteria bacterium]
MRVCERSQVYARPLIPLLLALMAGIVVGLWLPNFSGTFLVVAVVLLFSVLFVSKRQKVYLLPLFLFFILGYLSLQSWTSPRLPANYVSRFVDDRPWHIIGTLDSHPEQFPDRTRFILKAESLARKGVFYKVSGAVRVTIREPVAGLRLGDRVACLARLKEIRNFNNPGGFDYRRYLAFRGIHASASVSRESFVIRLHPAKICGFRQAIDRSRQAVSGLIDRATSTPEDPKTGSTGQPAQRAQPAQRDARGVIKALLIGDRSEVSREIRDVFNRIGTAHLLAISGLHIGIVATLAFLGFRFVLARSQRVLLAAWPAKGAALLSLFPVLFYGFLAGMSPATQRAVIMVMVFLMALLFERERDTINTLTLAALVILIICPTALFEISFQLSFTAVFAILYMLKHFPFVVGLRGGPPTVYKRLVLFLLVSAAAILGTFPITLYYFNQTSLIGILTNCFMVPVIGFLVVPAGLLAVLFLPISATIALWIMKGATVILEGGMGLAIFFSKWPFAAVKTVTPTLIEIGLYYALAWVLFNFRQTRRAMPLVIGLAIVALADVGYWVSERYGRRELRMTVIDVGQGSSALMELPGGPCVLVDGGGFYDNRFDVGARVVGPFLWKRKIATVEILVLSHPDSDHLNGLLSIARHFNVREVWMNQEHPDTEPYRDFLQIISEKNIRVVGLKDLVKSRMINGVRFQVLYPPPDFLERKAEDGWRTKNNNSLVLKVSFRDISFILPGDIEAEAENELTSLACTALKSNVLLVPHHGGQNSSTHEFLKCVAPDIGAISSGWKNIFGFPHQKTLKRYQAQGCQIFRTDRHGAITITTDGTHLTVKPFLL